jgi:hypothetical protein
LSEYDQNQLIDEAMARIVEENFSGHHEIIEDFVPEPDPFLEP